MSSDLGISNFEIERIINSSQTGDLKNNFVGVFPSNKINRFINFHSMMREKPNEKYPILVSNTDRTGAEGTHWWGILDIHPKTEIFLFDSFSVKGLENFIIQDDKKLIDKILFRIEKMARTDDKLS